MKKYLHIPKIVSVIFFAIFALIFVVSSVLYNNESASIGIMSYYGEEMLEKLLLYFMLMVFSGPFAIGFVVSCVLKTISKICAEKCLKKRTFLKLWQTINILQIIVGIIFIVVFYQLLKQGQSLGSTSLFGINNLCIDEQRKTQMTSMLMFVLAFLCLALAIIIFIHSSKERKTHKKIKIISKRNEELGFVYEECEFYKQTQILYELLNHSDGTLGEFEIYRQLKGCESKGIRFAFNREIPKEDGLSTEIDVLLIDKNGIIAIENKDYSGTIYGKAKENTWTYIDSQGKKITIYNPVKQNEGHIKALKSYFEVINAVNADIPIYSVISFTDYKTNKSDEVISRINMQDSDVKICTSQNLSFIVEKLLQKEYTQNVNVESMYELLTKLPVRKKY